MDSVRTKCGNCNPAAYEALLKGPGGCKKKPESPTMGSPCSPSSPKAGSPSSPSSPRSDELKKWPRADNRRMLHVVYRVGDIEKTMKYYTECLGMTILRKRDVPDEKYMNVFLGYGAEDNHFVAELTYNYGVTKYELGTGLGHFGIAVLNVQKSLDLIKSKGYKVPGGPTKEGKDVFAFVEDPDGYKFKLMQRGKTREPFCQVSYRVSDIDRAILFYQDAYGMRLLARRNFPKLKKTLAYVAYDMDETRTIVIEFEYNYGKTDYSKGTAYAQIAIGTDDVYKTAGAAEMNQGKTARPPGALPGLTTKIYACLDPDGWKTVFVDNRDFERELEPASFAYQVKTTTKLS